MQVNSVTSASAINKSLTKANVVHCHAHQHSNTKEGKHIANSSTVATSFSNKKNMSWDEAMSNNEEIRSIAISLCMHQSVSKFCEIRKNTSGRV